MPNGCLAQIESCRAAAANGDYNYSTPISSESDPAVFTICSEAQSMCRDNVEGVYYSFVFPFVIVVVAAPTDNPPASPVVVPTISVTPAMTLRLLRT
jgi:hypothetical protein